MLPRTLRPADSLTSATVRRGLAMLLMDGVCSQVMIVLTSGAFLVAFALLLGASNRIIGVIAAMGPLGQVLQIPGALLVDRIQLRKALVVSSATLSRVFILVMAAVPWFLPAEHRLPVFVLSLFLFYGVGAIGGAAFSPWMRDLVPHRIMGRYFGRRLAAAIGSGAVVSLLAGRAVDAYVAGHAQGFPAYSALFVIAAAVGFIGIGFLTGVPEPRMTPPPARSITAIIAEPLRDERFRKLISFFGTWSFAVNFAGPFFSVFLLQRLGLSMTWIMALFVVSQASNVAFLRVWGHIADRLTNKAVLSLAAPLFLVSIALWPFTMLPERHVLTIPILVLIHVLAGISTAGVMLCGWNVALRLAPKDRAAAYLAANALVSGLAATAAPILAGLSADWMSAAGWHVAIGLPRIGRLAGLPVLDLRALEFVFLFAIIAGAFALRSLRAVTERQGAEQHVSLADIQAEIRTAFRSASSVAGLRLLWSFPYGILRRRTESDDDASDEPLA